MGEVCLSAEGRCEDNRARAHNSATPTQASPPQSLAPKLHKPGGYSASGWQGARKPWLCPRCWECWCAPPTSPFSSPAQPSSTGSFSLSCPDTILAHVSAGEESAREPTSVIHFLGTHGISLRVCGAENPSQGPWEPGALRVALNPGGQATAGGALQLPFPSL